MIIIQNICTCLILTFSVVATSLSSFVRLGFNYTVRYNKVTPIESKEQGKTSLRLANYLHAVEVHCMESDVSTTKYAGNKGYVGGVADGDQPTINNSYKTIKMLDILLTSATGLFVLIDILLLVSNCIWLHLLF
jgi:hypothetical protein